MVQEIVASKRILSYFDKLKADTNILYEISQKARKKGLDPETHVDILLAASISQRVEALISSVAPQILDSGVADRIDELEQQHGPGDWRVALVIAKEIAQEKFCKFESQLQAIEIGVRTGLAYTTQGVVAGPLEGIVDLKFKKRRDGKDYLAIYYAGPIRASGGTAQVIPLLLLDYLRKEFGIAKYDPTEDEISRYYVEVQDYSTRVARKQYIPAREEIAFIIQNCPIEINADPSERIEVSNFKRLDRVETPQIRGGLCLVLTDGLPLKAAKLLKQINKWGAEFGLEDWKWLADFLEIKKQVRSGMEEKNEVKSDKYELIPDTYFISEIVAGRPVFTHPLEKGGFRLRYGRSRCTGDGSWAISPLTMGVLDNYLATGTQLRVERPGKSTALTVCDSIDGPIVKLKDGSVLKPTSMDQIKKIKFDISEILFIGDLLISYGDFVEQGHNLIPPGYCVEWWARELEHALEKTHNKEMTEFINNPFLIKPSFEQAIKISKEFNIPLHPDYTFFWSEISIEQLKTLYMALKTNTIHPKSEAKRALELVGCPHQIKDNTVVFNEAVKKALLFNLGELNSNLEDHPSTLEMVNQLCKVQIRDKSGTTIGCRMGLPEKEKLREMKGSPNVLFPVGEEGGRLRSFQAALQVGEITADFPLRECPECNKVTIYKSCDDCGKETEEWRSCPVCKKKTKLEKCHMTTRTFENRKINTKDLFDQAKRVIGPQLPPLIKGVRGTSNKDHIPEYFPKGVLRAKHNLQVNKDGTIRYDMTELGVTHFKPVEIGLSVERAKELGYEKDIYDEELKDSEQLLEILPQDVILPSCPDSQDETADVVLTRIANFVDAELKQIYGLEPFFNIKSREDLIGHLLIGLAPHTSAGIIGRIIGFSEVVCCYAHPYWHDAQRRDLDGEETAVMLALEAFLNFSRQYLPDRRGGRCMDAPLVLTTILNPMEIDDEVYDVDIADKYPLKFYQATQEFKKPWEIKVEQIKHRLGKKEQYEGMRFTHPVTNINMGVQVSAYKAIPAMLDKLKGQIGLAKKIRAVNAIDVSRLVIEAHFLRDIKGNMRKYTQQTFRCVYCNKKYRRPPLSGTCNACKKGKLVFTIAEGSIKKYLDPSLRLAEIDGLDPYLQQSLKLLESRIDSVFGRDATKQIELEKFFG